MVSVIAIIALAGSLKSRPLVWPAGAPYLEMANENSGRFSRAREFHLRRHPRSTSSIEKDAQWPPTWLVNDRADKRKATAGSRFSALEISRLKVQLEP